MFRIGFDPMLDAELRNRELIKAVEQYQLVNEGLSHNHNKNSWWFKGTCPDW